ncbi:MAG: 30S ribosomal protein S3 [Betaproteobacteria bacterium SG8_39]|jgi:small subunit ribosomal protein S3|nr:MAG: 30S ribosomal protein S3 [Betaproteobacteria bacterium SG8_39]
MGQKINPIGFRLAVNRAWTSRWYANSRAFAPMLAEDIKVRSFLKKKLSHASVSRVLIERPAKDARITIFSARPGVVIGKKGEEIESLKAQLRHLMGVQQVHVNIEEVRKPETDAQLIADSIAQQLEKRIMFRRAMKRALQNAVRLGAQGVKIMSSGRLNGQEIARREWYREGRVPLHTLRADIDYGFSEAKTTYGVIGIKVWVYRGEVVHRSELPTATAAAAMPAPQAEEATPARRAKKPAPKAGAKRASAKESPAGEPAKKPAARRGTRKTAATGAVSDKPKTAAKPKTTVKRTRKVVKDASGDGGEKKE